MTHTSVTDFLTASQRQLWEQAEYLLKREKDLPMDPRVVDYGFIVFSAAKVYEGFLKHYLYQMGFISKAAFLDEHFRIGKALNPDLPNRFRDRDWLFDDVSQICGEEVADQLWQTWKLARNKVFHYEIHNGERLTFKGAQLAVEAVYQAMERAIECDTRIKRDE